MIVHLGLLENLRNLQWFWCVEEPRCHSASCLYKLHKFILSLVFCAIVLVREKN